jgi:hypothetical protein
VPRRLSVRSLLFGELDFELEGSAGIADNDKRVISGLQLDLMIFKRHINRAFYELSYEKWLGEVLRVTWK